MNEAYNVGFKDGASAGYKLAIEDMKLDKKPQIMKKYEGDYAVLEARYAALRDAVAWERECDECGEWLNIAWWDVNEIDLHEIWDIYECARAEVDRLIVSEGAANCKGEG